MIYIDGIANASGQRSILESAVGLLDDMMEANVDNALADGVDLLDEDSEEEE